MKAEVFWNKVYDVLVEECQAYDENYERANFVQQQSEKNHPMEWRFCGSLGFGGKFWRQSGELYVTCYKEDETPERLAAINKAKERLAKLAEEVKE